MLNLKMRSDLLGSFPVMYFPPWTLLARTSYCLPGYHSSASWLKYAHMPHSMDCAKHCFASLVKSVESFPSKDCHCKSCESLAGSLHCVEVPWAIPWACWAIMLFSSMKCSGRNVFMNKRLTFQHLHLEGNRAWVVIIWLWKAHSYVLSVFRGGLLGMIQRPFGTKRSFFIDSVGFGLNSKLIGGAETELAVSGEFGNAAQGLVLPKEKWHCWRKPEGLWNKILRESCQPYRCG